MRTLIVLIAFTMAAFGQRHKLEPENSATPEGKTIQQALDEADDAKKAALLEQYVADYPKSGGTTGALELLQAYYLKAGQPDKAIAAGEKLLAIDPADPDAALQSLKAAEAKKDPAMILKWAAATSATARKVAEKPKPAAEDEAADWKAEVDYAKQVDTYSEYALYRASLESTDPKVAIMLVEALRQQNPQSEYAAKAADPLFAAYRRTGANDKALALAESTLATEQTNTDMLLLVADNYIQNKKEPAKAHAYLAKVVEIAAQPKPEGTSDADWKARASMVTGLARYMNGKLYNDETDFVKADQELRVALPLVEANADLKPEVLFLLGFANYKLNKTQDALAFYKECAAIKSPYQATAAKNLEGVRNQSKGAK